MRIAVLGLGFMGSTHIKALESIPEAQLAAVYSRDASKLAGDLSGIQGNLGTSGQKFDFSGVSKFSDIDALLADPSLEAVDICLPTSLHAGVAINALRAGKHVLVEKPMALSQTECDSMIAESQRQGRVLMTAQVLRFFPMYIELQRVLAADLGPVRSALFRRRCGAPAYTRWLYDPQQSGGGVFDLLIHDADLCLHLFGMPEAVSATGYEAMQAGIDLVTANLHYAGDLTVVITGGWHRTQSYPFSMEYTVVTEGGTVEYSSAGKPPTLYRPGADPEARPMAEVNGYAAEIEYFVECCGLNKPPVRCPPAESAKAVALMRLLLEARLRQGERLPCNI